MDSEANLLTLCCPEGKKYCVDSRAPNKGYGGRVMLKKPKLPDFREKFLKTE